MAEDTPPVRRHIPWFSTLCGLAVIAALVAMPFLAGEPDGENVPNWAMFTGRFHPLLLHLPIGVFVLIFLQEGMAMFSKNRQRTSSFALFFGAVSAVLAVIAGFLLYHSGDYQGSDLAERHLWGGLAFAVGAVLTYIAKAWSVSLDTGAAFYRILLFGSVGVMGFASHDGGSLTHGSNYLTQYAPGPLKKWMGEEPKETPEPPRATEDQIVYVDLIAPILERTCVQCHKEGNAKGRLRMDTYEMLLKGGREGPAFEPGDSAGSNMVYRIELPDDDDEHMPPEGKSDLDAHELVIVKWWIDSGADPTKKLTDHETTEEVIAAIAKIRPEVAAEPVTDSTGNAEVRAVADGLAREFSGALSYESRAGNWLVFTTVSLRDGFGDPDLAKLEPVAENLVSVDLSGSQVTDQGLAVLTNASNLKSIRLAETSIGDASADVLVKLENLESVNLYGTQITDEGILKLAALPKLKRLYLWKTAVSEEAIDRLADQLPDCEIVTGI